MTYVECDICGKRSKPGPKLVSLELRTYEGASCMHHSGTVDVCEECRKEFKIPKTDILDPPEEPGADLTSLLVNALAVYKVEIRKCGQ